MKPGRLLIGTSGWHYPHWVGPFYPEHMRSSEFLAFYTQHFHSVEINNTFYHLPTREALAEWGHRTPKHFVFSCKASRFITHMKKLKDPEQSIQKFFEAIQMLGNKLGPILFQLPPRWKINLERLDHFLNVLPEKHLFAFEFRDESWFEQDTYTLLSKHNAAFCVCHLAEQWSPMEVTADFVYLRLHGPKDPYQGRYGNRVLQTLAKKCLNWSKQGKNVYCYFDNDENGFAARDGAKLKNLVENT